MNIILKLFARIAANANIYPLSTRKLLALMGIATTALTNVVCTVADAASPGISANVRVLTARPANLDMTLPAQPYLLRVSPKVDACRFGILVIAPGATAAALKLAAANAVSHGKTVGVNYATDADNFCVVNSISPPVPVTGPATAQPVSVASTSVSDLGVYEGYHNAFATANKSAFRDFGQDKFDERVDPITGRLTLTHMDVVIPGPNGLDIRVMRNYISPDATEIVNSLDGGITLEPQFNGFGWHVIANFGGIRGMMTACDMGALTGVQGATSDFDGFHMRAETLPQWINANGVPEPLVPVLTEGQVAILPASPFKWRGASGVSVECGFGDVYPIATLADGTKIEMFATTNIGYQTVAPFNAFPTKITDRWGNWIAFEYDLMYAGLLYGASNFSVRQSAMAGSIPITRITASDGREVRFVYESGAPGWSAGNAIPLTEKILKRIEYGAYKVEYSYDRVIAGGLNILAMSSGKYFLRRVDLPDGLNWGYSYLPPPANIATPIAGQALLSQLTYLNGGTASYEWGGSAMTAIAQSYGGPLPKTFQLRKKTTSDFGVWRYSYTDMWRTAADEALDPIPTLDGRASGAGAVMPYTSGLTVVNLEAGRITGPTGIEIFHHFPRYCDPTFANFSNVPDGYGCGVPSWQLGRLMQHTIYPLGTVFSPSTVATASQVTTQTYVPIYFNVGFFGERQSVLPVFHGACSDTRCPAGEPWQGDKFAYLVRPVVTTVKRGTSSYVANNTDFMSYCGRPTAVTENGQRNRTMTYVFDRNAHCQTTSQQVNENGVRRSRTAMSLTSDGRNVATETRYGPTDAIGLSAGYTYLSTGEIASKTDARTYRTYFDNYVRGTPQSEFHPVNSTDGIADPQRIVVSRTVDDLGRITSETDGEGRTTTFAYNGRHKPTTITLPRVGSDRVISFAYGANTDTMTRGARSETVNYDGFGRVTSANNGINTTTYRYDAAGRRAFVSYPAVGATNVGQTVEFDALSRPTKLIEPDPSNNAANVETLIAYDDNTNSVSVTNPRGAVTTMTMEAFGDPSGGWLVSRVSPEIGVTNFTRNVFGQITKISQGGVDRTMNYDADKGYFLTQETHPELGATYFDRDSNGNAVGRRLGSASAPLTSYSFDGQDRLVATVAPANGAQTGQTVTNAWYKTGQLQSTVVAGGVSRAYTYDDHNNLSTEQVTIGGVPRTLAYAYDSLDSLSAIAYPSGSLIELNPDVLGRPRQVGGAASSINVVNSATYWPSGLPRNISFANGVSQDYVEQARPLLSGLSVTKGGSSYMNLGFGYDKVGNLLSTADALGLGYGRSASYDLFDRIQTNGTEAFSYEGVGDIKTKTGATYAYDGSRLLSAIGGAINRTYYYDGYGNATSDGRGFNYAYDALNTLRQVSGGTSTFYDYDGHQHLAKKIAADGITHYLYGKSGRLFGEYVIGTSKSKEYFYLGNKLVGQLAQ